MARVFYFLLFSSVIDMGVTHINWENIVFRTAEGLIPNMILDERGSSNIA